MSKERISFVISGEDDGEHLMGAVIWDGVELTFASGEYGERSDRIMQEILEEPIYLPVGDVLMDVYAKDDPETFIENIHRHYKSAYFRATKARDVKPGDLDTSGLWKD